MTRTMPLLSVVVPIYFEEETIPEFYDRMKKVLCSLESEIHHEIIFVNDGSTDRSFPMLSDLAARDALVKVINLSRNFGHQLAITAGIDNALGDAVIVIDGDLQDPPEVIIKMVTKWKEGYQVVYGVRNKRDGESFFKLITASIFYRFMQKLSDVKLPLDAGDFRLMDRKVVNALSEIREENRYIRGLISWIGFKQCGVPYDRDSRYAGVTKFDVSKMLRFALDGITSFSDKPLLISSRFGALITLCSFLVMLWLVISKIIDPLSSVQGWTSMLVVILFIGGIQLISIGILGEYIGRIYRETKKRPLYIIADKLGYSDSVKGEQIEN